MTCDLSELEENANKLTNVIAKDKSYDNCDYNFVIRGLPFHEGENLNSKVNSVIPEVLLVRGTLIRAHVILSRVLEVITPGRQSTYSRQTRRERNDNTSHNDRQYSFSVQGRYD